MEHVAMNERPSEKQCIKMVDGGQRCPNPSVEGSNYCKEHAKPKNAGGGGKISGIATKRYFHG
jgi:hypothetical protein